MIHPKYLKNKKLVGKDTTLNVGDIVCDVDRPQRYWGYYEITAVNEREYNYKILWSNYLDPGGNLVADKEATHDTKLFCLTYKVEGAIKTLYGKT